MYELPEHIKQTNGNWFYNEKTKKYIHKDKIDGFLERYWHWRKEAGKAVGVKKKIFRENKLAENRWFGKD